MYQNMFKAVKAQTSITQAVTQSHRLLDAIYKYFGIYQKHNKQRIALAKQIKLSTQLDKIQAQFSDDGKSYSVLAIFSFTDKKGIMQGIRQTYYLRENPMAGGGFRVSLFKDGDTKPIFTVEDLTLSEIANAID